MNRFLFLILYSISVVYASATPRIPLTKVSPKGGVAITSVMCINEDYLGFIWFGTNNGLFKYNTHNIKRYSYSQSDTNTIPTNRINTILNDAKGQLYIATENGICIYQPDQDNFKRIAIKDNYNHSIGTEITNLLQTNNGSYWMLDEVGIAKLDLQTYTAEYIKFDIANSRPRLLYKDSADNLWVVFQNGSIYFKQPDSNNFSLFSKGLQGFPRAFFKNDKNIWVGYDQDGLLCFDLQGNLIKHYSVDNNFISNRIRSVVEAEDGNIWVGTYNGIAIINNLTLVKTLQTSNSTHLPNQSVWSLYKDSNDIIWIGTWLGGLCYYSEYNKSVSHTSQLNSNTNNSHYVVSSFAQDPDSVHIWIGTEEGLLSRYNQLTRRNIEIDVRVADELVKNIRCLAFDKNERLWIGTRGDGVIYKDKHQDIFKQLTTPFETGLQTLSILPVDNGIWVSDYQQGVFFYSFEDKNFTRYQHNPLNINTISDKHVRKIIEDQKGNIWFATQNGLNLLKKGSNNFIHYFHIIGDSMSLAEDYNYCMLESNNGDIWLGTNGSGLDKLNISTLKFEHYTKKDGLPGNDIYSIIEDEQLNLWLSTDNGICKFNPEKKEVITFGQIDGIYNNSFIPNAALNSYYNIMFFGGSNGFVNFRPKDILTSNTIVPQTILTNCYIQNELILPKQENEILLNSISQTKEIKLSHSQNSFSFSFVAVNYINPDNNKFKYRLVGFNDSWIETGNYNKAIFTNIPAGKYIFEVKACNNDGLWNNKNTTKLNIKISRPIWNMWFAYIFYIAIILAVLLYLRRESLNRQKLKTQFELEKVKRESEENLNHAKLQFFTNISHEFRTPLTLIMGPVNRIINNYKLDNKLQGQLDLIKNNSERLLRLINQILDFRKIEAGQLKFTPTNSDLVDCCKGVFRCFNEHAKHRSFNYIFEANSPKLNIDIDTEKVDKIVFNILSNAFKYTPDEGKIVLSIKTHSNASTDKNDADYSFGDAQLNEFIEISVSDNGNGIEKDKLAKIFERFYQLENTNIEGSGIGLALAKEYINIHRGVLLINSAVNKGTTVRVRLPIRQTATDTNKTLEASLVYNDKQTIPETYSPEENLVNTESKYRDSLILIVEDNNELLDYLANVLGDNFKVVKAKNGMEGLEMVNSTFPDLIISDIMMPKMDGIELCESIKKDIQTSHIPVILLTALETIKDRISGLNSGADAYVSKPFSDKLLIAQIINLLESRKKLRESFADINDEWQTDSTFMDMDNKLILKAIEVAEANLLNSEFTIDNLADELNLSRTTLHRKLKSLTNQSATEFIRHIRLKKAVKLLQLKTHKVNEVGYAVGFNSHNYFTTSFKKQFGVSPSEYVANNFLNDKS